MAVEIADTILRYAMTLALSVAVISACCGRRGSWRGPDNMAAIVALCVAVTAAVCGMAFHG